jgi:hypothetical protein
MLYSDVFMLNMYICCIMRGMGGEYICGKECMIFLREKWTGLCDNGFHAIDYRFRILYVRVTDWCLIRTLSVARNDLAT